MKTLKRLLTLILAVLTIGTLCACSDGSSDDSFTTDTENQVLSAVEAAPSTENQTHSEVNSDPNAESFVRNAVTARGWFEYYGATIGGNELTSSEATITNLKKISATEYRVSGRVTMTDVYGTKWNNTFDCKVTKSGDSWKSSSFEYTNEKWQGI